MHRPVPLPVLAMLLVSACGHGDRSSRASRRLTAPRPDELPALLSAELPFRYPASLYARKVQGNVTLRLFVDRDGRVLPDSSRVEEPSGVPALDSAALAGARELKFVPAKTRGEPTAVTILFPVYFRHPEAAPMPGDTVFKTPAGGSAAASDD